MKLIVSATLAVALATPAALAQTAPATATVSAAKFNLDTAVEAIVADAQAKAVLDANIPGLTTHAHYEMFKSMSLRAIQPMSDGKITENMLKKVETDLAAIK